MNKKLKQLIVKNHLEWEEECDETEELSNLNIAM